jgi:hypothetical protein
VRGFAPAGRFWNEHNLLSSPQARHASWTGGNAKSNLSFFDYKSFERSSFLVKQLTISGLVFFISYLSIHP